MSNIVMMCKRDIPNKLCTQMLQYFYCKNGFLQEEVIGTRDYNLEQTCNYKEKIGLYEAFTEDIRSVLFTRIKKGVFSSANLDSKDGELTLAHVLENKTMFILGQGKRI